MPDIVFAAGVWWHQAGTRWSRGTPLVIQLHNCGREGGGWEEVEERRWRKGGGGEEVEERRWRREEKVGEGWFGSGQGSLCGRWGIKQLKTKCSKILGLTSNSSFSFWDMYIKWKCASWFFISLILVVVITLPNLTCGIGSTQEGIYSLCTTCWRTNK